MDGREPTPDSRGAKNPASSVPMRHRPRTISRGDGRLPQPGGFEGIGSVYEPLGPNDLLVLETQDDVDGHFDRDLAADADPLRPCIGDDNPVALREAPWLESEPLAP